VRTFILDSLSTLKLVTLLEERFKVELGASDRDAGNLASVANIASLVAVKAASHRRTRHGHHALAEPATGGPGRPISGGADRLP
jgi:hypothetical protein